MNILIFGDIVGRSGRDIFFRELPRLKEKYRSDFIVVDVDNATHGFGISRNMASDFFSAGVNVLTGGNHLFDQKDALSFLNDEKRFLRPDNMAPSIPGSGVCETTLQDGRKVVTIHLVGQNNMPILGDNPFLWTDNLLKKYKLGANVNAIIVDFHAETTSEKAALGQYLDGRVSVVFGTHTHVPTADYRILKHGSAYQTDVGMCGDYDSILGMEKATCVERFTKGYHTAKMTPAMGNGTLYYLAVSTNDKTGLAESIDFQRVEY